MGLISLSDLVRLLQDIIGHDGDMVVDSGELAAFIDLHRALAKLPRADREEAAGHSN